jgi:hypothetical protein
MTAAAHGQLRELLAREWPAERLITDPLRLLAWGTDASFYRLVPQLVVVVETEAELQRLLGPAQPGQRLRRTAAARFQPGGVCPKFCHQRLSSHNPVSAV